jgi:S1-C subfamily serine protease
VKSQKECETIADVLGGLLIVGCLPNSSASILGLRYGDVVVEVNGTQTATLGDFFEARLLDDSEMKLRVFRDGRVIDLRLTLNHDRRGNIDELRSYLTRRSTKDATPHPLS